jgi:hypothetical protein
VIIHPELRALREDDLPQRVAQTRLIAAADEWRRQAETADLLNQLDRFAAGAVLGECPVLDGLLCGPGRVARDFAKHFVRSQLAMLAESPLGHLAFRHFTDGSISTLLLARAGNVTLSLVAIDGEGLAERPMPASVSFSPSEMWEHVLAGAAQADLVEREGEDHVELKTSTLLLEEGTRISRDASRQALVLRVVEGRLVSLRLQRRQRQAGEACEYDRASGRLVHKAAGNPRDSRIELMVALLGRLQRRDAAPLIGALAREPGSAGLRWQALRECLALDTRTGFGALCALAASPDDPLAPPAGALRAQLIETYPQLARMVPCLESST